MTSSDAKPTRITARRAAWLGVLLAILVAAGYVDRQLKTASHPAFLPEDMPLYIRTADLPQTWLHFAQTPLAGNLAEEAAPVLHDIELYLRQLTGIRPTPARWRTWLGGSMTAATDAHDWILCVHPGLVARAASLIFPGKALPTRQVRQAWRQGCLLLASSPELIKKALAAPPVAMDIPETASSDTLVVELRTPVRTVLTITPSDDLPIEARIFQPSTSPPRTPAVWSVPLLPGNPIAVLSLPDAPSATQLAALLAAFDPHDFSGGLLGGLLSRWGLSHLRSFLSPTGPSNAPMSFALYGLSLASGAPLPQLALASSTKEGFATLFPTPQSPNRLLPYDWNGCPGWMFPLLGDQFSLYGFQRDNTQYLATREPLAAMLASAPQTPPPGSEDDAVITLNWKRATEAIIETASWAAARELLHERNQKDLDATFIPIMHALSKCGTLQLTGRWTPEGFLCKGQLTALPRPEHAQ